MHWIAPSEKDTASGTLEKRLWDSAGQFRANSAVMVLLVLLLLSGIGLNAAAADKPAKVFILAGQSNMEGKAPNALFDHQATNSRTREFFAHLRQGDRWIVRDDVLIIFLDRKGPLTLGYGSSYRAMLAEVREVLTNPTLFPALKDRPLELADFVWFQGWNDQYGSEHEYESNLKHLIADVRVRAFTATLEILTPDVLTGVAYSS